MQTFNRIFLNFLLLWLCAATAVAQEHRLTGTVADLETKNRMEQATVQLLNRDSSYVSGATTDSNGTFTVKVPRIGRYIVKVSNVGYATSFSKVVINADATQTLATIFLRPSSIMLKGATVTANVPKVTLSKDTFVYNATAFRTPEGSTVEELVKRLPGAKIDDEGKITINGKEVKKIKVDGKEFMVGDTKTVMKNLPTNIVGMVKAYDEKSDLARVSGIDDGNEQTVLDFRLKRGMNNGFLSNIDLSYATHSRYAERLMGGYLNSRLRVMAFGSFNNTGDMGFPGGGGRGSFGGGRSGLQASKMAATNFNYAYGDKLAWDGSVRWNHLNNDVIELKSAETFAGSDHSFSNSFSHTNSKKNQWNMQMRMEWKPDTLTNIMFRPNMSFSTSDSKQTSTVATFNDDPYAVSDDPLTEEAMVKMREEGKLVNTQRSGSIGYGEAKNFGGMLQINRKLGSKGRNVTLRGDFSYSDSKNDELSIEDINYYQVVVPNLSDSIIHLYRYNLTPERKFNASSLVTYSEPLWRGTFLQFGYKFSYSYSRSEGSTYDFSNLERNVFSGFTPAYRQIEAYLSRLDHPYTYYADQELSRFSESRDYVHDIDVMLRMVRQKYLLNVGVKVQPQTNKFVQDYREVHTDTVRHAINVMPTFDFRYNFSNVSRLRINYNGSTSQPSMADLVDITDDINPIHVTRGNPGLKPSFTNALRAEYWNYFPKHKMSIVASANYSNTLNQITNSMSYNASDGSYLIQPENINGNWNAGGMLVFNMAIDTAGVWNINNFTEAKYTNSVSHSGNADAMQRSLTRTTAVGEWLGVSYRNSWLEVQLDGAFDLNSSRNNLRKSSNLDTWRFAYGGSLSLTVPWGTSLFTGIHQNSRRGFADNSLNTNELIWNVQLSQSFLKSKALSVSLQLYDILQQQSNLSHSVTSSGRTDVQYNAITSYAMLHVAYRLNVFGGKQARKGGREAGFMRPDRRPPMDGRRPDGGMNRPPMGPPPGRM